jgi:DNA repair exonuclease SbcCD ATPase subunit
MTLQDYIREKTQEINDDIKLIEEEKTSKICEKNAVEERIKRTGSLISEQHKKQSEKKKEIEGITTKLKEINTQLEEIERQKRLLLEKYDEIKANEDEAKDSISKLEQDLIKAQRQINSEKNSIAQIEYLIEEKEKDRNRNDKKLRLAHVSAFKSFLENSNSLIEEYFKRITSRKTIIETAENFRKKRHEDTHVADLCEQRDEWKKILKTTFVPGVKEAANKALKTIEVEIDKMFPGALEEENSSIENNPTTELYYHEDDEETIIFFPFLEKQWKSMELGNKDNSVETFGRFIELIIKETKLSYNDAHLKCENDMVQLVSKFGLGNLKGKNDITFSIVGKDNMTFILSRIPDEVYKSLNYEEATT